MSLLHTVYYDGMVVCAMRSEAEKSFADNDCPHGTESVVYKSAKILKSSQKKDISLPVFTDEEIQSIVNDKKNTYQVEGYIEESSDSMENDKTPIQFDEFLPLMDRSVVRKPTAKQIQDKIFKVRGFTDNKASSYAYLQNVELKCKNLTPICSGSCTITSNNLSNSILEDQSATFDEDGVIIGDIVVIDGSYIGEIVSAGSGTTLGVSEFLENGHYSIYHPMTVDEAKDALRKKDPETDEVITDLTEEEAENLLIDEFKTNLANAQVKYLINECCIVPTLSTEVYSGTCVTSGAILTDSNASFVTDNVAINNLVKIGGSLYKIDSVTNETTLELKKTPFENIEEETDFKVLDSEFMAQFDYHSSSAEL